MKKIKIPFSIDLKKINEVCTTNRKLIFTVLLIFVVLQSLALIGAFFWVVKSPEKVLVPNIVGKELTEALQIMEAKELYPKIQLKYSDNPQEKGTVLEQSPEAGVIVKAGRRITLTISKGVILDRLENYVGMKLDALQTHLQTLFATSQPMVLLPPAPTYKTDAAEEGTILEQYPPANTILSEPVELSLVVSAGAGHDLVAIPNITNLSLNDVLLQMSRNKIIFNFTAQEPTETQQSGIVISQKWPVGTTQVPVYSRINAVITIPKERENGLVYGIFTQNLPPYPYALPVELIAEPPKGEKYTIVSFKHLGGLLTIPYAVPQHTRLIFTVLGKETHRLTVQ